MIPFDVPDEFVHWSPEAEGGVVGGLLVGGAEAFDAVADLLAPDDFHGTLHAAAFAAVQSLVLAGQAVDLVAVYEELRRTGTEADLQRLHEFTHHFVGTRVLRQHAQLVADRAVSRSLQRAADDVRGIAADVATPVADRISQSQARLERVQQVTACKATAPSSRPAANRSKRKPAPKRSWTSSTWATPTPLGRLMVALCCATSAKGARATRKHRPPCWPTWALAKTQTARSTPQNRSGLRLNAESQSALGASLPKMPRSSLHR